MLQKHARVKSKILTQIQLWSFNSFNLWEYD